jgi:hypothetical protein
MRILDQNDAAGFLDRLDADGTVRSRARKDDGEVVAMLRGQRAEKAVDRRALPARFVEFGEREMMIGRHKLPVGRNDVDMAGFKRREPGDLRDRHLCARGGNAGQLARAPGIEMDDNHKSSFEAVRQRFEKRLQGFDAAGGRADANRREAMNGRLVGDFSFLTGRQELVVVVGHRWPGKECEGCAFKGLCPLPIRRYSIVCKERSSVVLAKCFLSQSHPSRISLADRKRHWVKRGRKASVPGAGGLNAGTPPSCGRTRRFPSKCA